MVIEQVSATNIAFQAKIAAKLNLRRLNSYTLTPISLEYNTQHGLTTFMALLRHFVYMIENCLTENSLYFIAMALALLLIHLYVIIKVAFHSISCVACVHINTFT